DALDLHHVLNGLEAAIGRTVIDDGLGFDRTDSRQCFKLFLGRGIDIDRRERKPCKQQRKHKQQELFHLTSKTLLCGCTSNGRVNPGTAAKTPCLCQGLTTSRQSKAETVRASGWQRSRQAT